MKLKLFIQSLIIMFPSYLFSQQIADTSYKPVISNPEYKTGNGPVVFIDEGHHNFHTKNGRYSAFAALLERDGYNVLAYKGAFKEDQLSKGRILVISNALNEINVQNWYLPTPSAFSKNEIEVIRKWVNNGGSLFLIADHMPMAGAATELAAAFEFGCSNGFVFTPDGKGTAFFSLSDSSLGVTVLTKGRNESESVNSIVTFTGQGFTIPKEAVSILTFGEGFYSLQPDTAWVFNDSTTKVMVKGWSQGAYRKYGKGRVAMFGEAAMFTAQLAGPEKRKVGMNQPDASQNYKLLLNIIHWLDGKF